MSGVRSGVGKVRRGEGGGGVRVLVVVRRCGARRERRGAGGGRVKSGLGRERESAQGFAFYSTGPVQSLDSDMLNFSDSFQI